MLTMLHKPYTCRHDVEAGDVIIFKCIQKPNADVLHLGYNDRQWWLVKEKHKDSVVLKKTGTERTIEMVLHDWKVSNHVMELKPEKCDKPYKFFITCGKVFHVRDIAKEIFFNIKQKLLSWSPFSKSSKRG